MKLKQFAALIPALAVVVLPFTASAHEHAVYEIGHNNYQIGIGSLNEPIAVDDKTGVEFEVTMVGHEGMAANDHHGEGGGVEGLEETLKVEVSAGGEKKVFDLTPAWNAPGSYYATFYPTVATTYSYRVFGTLGGAPFDVTYTCLPRGEEAAEGEDTPKDLGGGVTQVSRSGAFGCPSAKEDLGFPKASASVADVAETGSMNSMVAWGAGLLSIIALGASLRRKG